MASTASTASVASMTYTTSFHQKKNDWYWWLDHPWHQNDQYWSLIVERILKNPIFHWYLVCTLSVGGCWGQPMLLFSKPVDDPNLLKPIGTIIQENYQSFYPSEPFTLAHFKMRHPVAVLIFSLFAPYLETALRCVSSK